jgi:hypothetical protein
MQKRTVGLEPAALGRVVGWERNQEASRPKGPKALSLSVLQGASIPQPTIWSLSRASR